MSGNVVRVDIIRKEDCVKSNTVTNQRKCHPPRRGDREPQRKTLNQMEKDKRDRDAKIRAGEGREHIALNVIESKYGKITLQKLTGLANLLICIHPKDLPELDRVDKRHKKALWEWFDYHWEKIQPVLPEITWEQSQ